MMTHFVRRLLMILIVVTMPLAMADDDPIPDSVEALGCGFPALAGVINALPPSTGGCSGTTDYVNPIFTPTACPECTTATSFQLLDVPLTPARDVQAVALPPTSIPAQGPFNTPPVDQPVGTVLGFRSGQSYCVSITPTNGNPMGQCVDVGPLASLIPPIGPTEFVHVPSETIGPTPGVSEGQVGATPAQHAPATSFDLTLTTRWVEPRLNQRLGPGLVNVWEPVDLDNPAEVQWWANNGDRTTLDLTLVLQTDGAPLQSITVSMPYVGQAAAALARST